MWHAPDGETTFTGAFAYVLANSFLSLIDELKEDIRNGDDFCGRGHLAFDRLTNEQKAWSLHQAAFGLLDKKTESPPLVAYLEAAVAAVFREIEVDIEMEIDCAKDSPEGSDAYSIRRAVLAVYESFGGNSPDDFDDEEAEPLTVQCQDIEEWKAAVELLETKVFWDADYDDVDAFDDMPPQKSEAIKQEFGIADDYFTAAPNDPQPKEALKLLKEISKLCSNVIESE